MADVFTLSLAAVDILSDVLGINVRRFPFVIPSIGENVDERVDIASAVFTDLDTRGLLPDGDVAPKVLLGLRLLANYHVAIAVFGTVGGQPVYARVSSDGRNGVLASRQRQLLRFELIKPEMLVPAVVGLLPALAAGDGGPVAVGGDAVDAWVADTLRRPRTGTGYFLVSGRDMAGKETSAPALTWVDTADGRYAIRGDGNDTGSARGTFAPADNASIGGHLVELVHVVL
ncbi:MAG: ESX secretion-associated protein EspG [Sciscionella sp.]|nr:ESX secretion-associated protein EspG [Sciscionella sp.]